MKSNKWEYPNQWHFQDLTGMKFNKLTVLEFHSRNTSNHRKWLCRCECGNEVIRLGGQLKNGRTKSCGCLKKEKHKMIWFTHGLSGHSLYTIWGKMKARCYNMNQKGYHNYGGRGITVCDEWREDPRVFIEWALPRWKEGLTIDRIDVNSNYSPDNCRFIARSENNRFQRRHHVVFYNGERLTLAEFVTKYTNLSYCCVQTRMKRWGVDALNATFGALNFTKRKNGLAT